MKSLQIALLQPKNTSFDLYDQSTHRSGNGIHHTAPQPSHDKETIITVSHGEVALRLLGSAVMGNEYSLFGALIVLRFI